MISLVLIFGIFFAPACSTLFNTSENPETYLENRELAKAYDAVEEQIRENPENTELLLIRARILNDIAIEKENPADRHPDYENLKNSTDEIRYRTDQYNSRIDSLLVSSWTFEQQEGVKLLQQENSENFQHKTDRATAHFRNAITLIPDSTVTYSLKATTHYKNGDTYNAIETLENGREFGADFGPDLQEKLSYLYLEAGNFEKSVSLYKSLVEEYPENSKYIHGLVNALILKEEHSESISLLRDLIDQYPERNEYQEALAAELYFAESRRISDKISGQDEFTFKDVEEIIESFDEISIIYEDLNLVNSRSEESLFRAATFYSSSANHLLNLNELVQDSDNQIADKQLAYLEYSIPYWQALTEIFTDSIQYAEQLYRVYRLLDMNDEADLLYQQLNF